MRRSDGHHIGMKYSAARFDRVGPSPAPRSLLALHNVNICKHPGPEPCPRRMKRENRAPP